MINTARLSTSEIKQFFLDTPNLLTLIGMDYEGQNEDRNGLIYKLYIKENIDSNLITIKQENDSTYSITNNLNKEIMLDKIAWYDLKNFFKEYLIKIKIETILFDITDLDLDTLIYIIPLVLDYKICYIYTIPENYSSENFTIVPKEISQPKGYTFFPSNKSKVSSHIIILGFDELRASKFIKQYDWALDKLKLILVKDKVENCESRINNANYFFNEKLNPYQLKEVNLLDYEEIVRIIDEELKENDFIDIIPLGPKPVLFNILLYYFKNYDSLKDRIRFLYDFPNKSKNRTQGIKEICFSEIIF